MKAQEIIDRVDPDKKLCKCCDRYLDLSHFIDKYSISCSHCYHFSQLNMFFCHESNTYKKAKEIVYRIKS